MFENTVESVKKYWPWALGIVAVGFLLTRGGSGSAASDDGTIFYDPNLLNAETERMRIQSQGDTAIGLAAIQANAQVETAQLAAVAAGFQSLATLNDSFVAGNISTYQAIKDQSIAAVNAGANITEAGLLAAGQAQSSFNQAIGQSTQAGADIVSSIAQANAQSSGGFGRFFVSLASMAY